MKKMVKVLSLGVCCLMLTMTVSINGLNHNSKTYTNTHAIQLSQEMPD